MGHIAPETANKIVSNGAIKGIEVDPSTTIQSCDSCEYAKTTQKPIKKTRVEPLASKFGDEIHSDVWGPSPVQTPGRNEYYVSFTDNYTRWTHLQLLATKYQVFGAYKDFKVGQNSTLGSKRSKYCDPIGGENIWAKNSANTSHHKEWNTNLPCII